MSSIIYLLANIAPFFLQFLTLMILILLKYFERYFSQILGGDKSIKSGSLLRGVFKKLFFGVFFNEWPLETDTTMPLSKNAPALGWFKSSRC